MKTSYGSAFDVLSDVIALPRVGKRIRDWLLSDNIYTIEQLTALQEKEVRWCIPNIGPATFKAIKTELERHGLSFGMEMETGLGVEFDY